MKQRLSQSFVWTVVFVFPLFCRRKAFDDFCLLHLPHLPPQSCRRSQKCLARSSSMLCHGWGTCPCFFPSRRQKMWLGWPRLVFDNWRGRVTAIWIKETGWIFLFSCTVKVPFRFCVHHLYLGCSPFSGLNPPNAFQADCENDPRANIAFSLLMEWDRNALTWEEGGGIHILYITDDPGRDTKEDTGERAA